MAIFRAILGSNLAIAYSMRKYCMSRLDTNSSSKFSSAAFAYGGGGNDFRAELVQQQAEWLVVA
jgi:hypothetical protein